MAQIEHDKAFEYLNWYFTQDDGATDKNAVKAWEVLFRDQEPAEPIRQTEQTEWTVCGHCRKHLISKWMFCPYCGRAVKWNGPCAVE